VGKKDRGSSILFDSCRYEYEYEYYIKASTSSISSNINKKQQSYNQQQLLQELLHHHHVDNPFLAHGQELHVVVRKSFIIVNTTSVTGDEAKHDDGPVCL
jgi:hypothetical protein